MLICIYYDNFNKSPVVPGYILIVKHHYLKIAAPIKVYISRPLSPIY